MSNGDILKLNAQILVTCLDFPLLPRFSQSKTDEWRIVKKTAESRSVVRFGEACYRVRAHRHHRILYYPTLQGAGDSGRYPPE